MANGSQTHYGILSKFPSKTYPFSIMGTGRFSLCARLARVCAPAISRCKNVRTATTTTERCRGTRNLKQRPDWQMIDQAVDLAVRRCFSAASSNLEARNRGTDTTSKTALYTFPLLCLLHSYSSFLPLI